MIMQLIALLSMCMIFIFCLVSIEHFYFYWFDCIYVVFLGKIDNRWLWTVFFMWHVFWGNLYYDYEQSYLCDMYSGVLYIKAFIFDNEIKIKMVLNSTETELRQLSMGAWGVPDS